MKDHFLLETVWILFSYGAGYCLPSLLIALLLVAWGSGRKRGGVRMALLGTSVLILWVGLKQATARGRAYRNHLRRPTQIPGARLSFSSWGGARLWFCSAGFTFFFTGTV